MIIEKVGNGATGAVTNSSHSRLRIVDNLAFKGLAILDPTLRVNLLITNQRIAKT